MFSGGDGIAERRIHHNDTLLRRGSDIDIVDADTSAADDFQIVGSSDDLFGHLGCRADRKPFIIADDRGKLVLVLAKVGLEIDIKPPILENLDSGGRQFVGNQNAWHCLGHIRLQKASTVTGP